MLAGLQGGMSRGYSRGYVYEGIPVRWAGGALRSFVWDRGMGFRCDLRARFARCNSPFSL